MRRGSPAILAALDRGNAPAIEADQQDRGRCRVARRTQIYLCLAVIENERHRQFTAAASGKAERLFNIRAVRADRLSLAVDDDLRGIDRGEIACAGIPEVCLEVLLARRRRHPIDPRTCQPLPSPERSFERRKVDMMRHGSEPCLGGLSGRRVHPRKVGRQGCPALRPDPGLDNSSAPEWPAASPLSPTPYAPPRRATTACARDRGRRSARQGAGRQSAHTIR